MILNFVNVIDMRVMYVFSHFVSEIDLSSSSLPKEDSPNERNEME